MKIAYVVDRFPVLSETFVINQITGLLDRGHDVEIFAKTLQQGPLPPDVARYELLARTTFWPALPATRGRRFARALRLFARGLRGGAAGLRAADPRYGIEAASGNVAYAAAAIPTPRTFDAIHAHFGNVGVRAQALRDLGRLRGPLATTFHGFDLSVGARGRRAGRVLAGYGALFSRGDLFLPVTDRWRARLVELGCPAGSIVTHRMGIDLRRFQIAARARDPSAPLRLVSVSRLVEKKGIAVALAAIAQLGPAARVAYTVAGDGPLRAELERDARALGVGDVVTFTGAVPPPRVAELLRDADVMLAPSVVARDGDEEGLPVAIMEAMASGLVVIASRHSGIPELVVDGETGYLAPERDAAALARAIERATAERARWPAIRAAARARVEAQHDIARLDDRLVELLAGAGAR